MTVTQAMQHARGLLADARKMLATDFRTQAEADTAGENMTHRMRDAAEIMKAAPRNAVAIQKAAPDHRTLKQWAEDEFVARVEEVRKANPALRYDEAHRAVAKTADGAALLGAARSRYAFERVDIAKRKLALAAEHPTPGHALAAFAKEIAKADNLTFAAAFNRVAAQAPWLAEKYQHGGNRW